MKKKGLKTGVDILLLLIMVLFMGSGIVLFRHVFAFLPIFPMQTIARNIHLTVSYWGFVLMAVHIGFHGGMILKRVVKAGHIPDFMKQNKIIVQCGVIGISLYGVYAFLSKLSCAHKQV